MIQLAVPYRSQWDVDARRHSADCGPTCLAMLLNYFQIAMTPDRVYDFLPEKEPGQFTRVGELMQASRDNGLVLKYVAFADRAGAIANLRDQVSADNPLIALVKYAPWQATLGNHFTGGHFVVVTGFDDDRISFHDPLFGNWQARGKGSHQTRSADFFCAGWGGFENNENPNWAGFFAATPSENMGRVDPDLIPEPPTQTIEHPDIAPEVARRIRALAGFYQAPPPDLTDAPAAQAWLAHLGDWGAEISTYTVITGDSLSLLAARFYQGQSHWQAIARYNDLSGNFLWIGQQLRIPQIGTTIGDPPLDVTLELAPISKGTQAEHPDVEAQNYDALSPNSVGIGFME